MNYEDWKRLNDVDWATRVRDLHDNTIALLLDNVTTLIDSGHYPKEVFHEVRWVQKLIRQLQYGNTTHLYCEGTKEEQID